MKMQAARRYDKLGLLKYWPNHRLRIRPARHLDLCALFLSSCKAASRAERGFFRRLVLVVAASFSLLLSSASMQAAMPSLCQAGRAAEILEPAKPIERELKGDEVHAYRLMVEQGQYARVVVDQRGVDVVVKLFAPDARQLGEFDSPTGTHGLESIKFLSEESGYYRLEISCLERGALGGSYEVNLREVRKSTQQDKAEIAAEKALAEGDLARAAISEESHRKAILKYEESLSLWREAGNRRGEGEALSKIGRTYLYLGNGQKALEYFNQALPVVRSQRDRKAEGDTLDGMGVIAFGFGGKQKALDYLEEALSLRREAKDPLGEAETLNNIGTIYSRSTEPQKALDYFSQSLPIWREFKQAAAEAYTLDLMGVAHSSLNEYSQALDHLVKALEIRKEIGDQSGQAYTNMHLAAVYDEIKEFGKALDHYLPALAHWRSLKDPAGEASVLNNIGKVYTGLSENQKALEHLNKALEIRRTLNSPVDTASTLINIGSVYMNSGEMRKAMGYYEEALRLSRAESVRRLEAQEHEGIALNGIGSIYAQLGDKQKAIEHLEQALAIRSAVKDSSGEAATLYSIGSLYLGIGDKRKAIEYIEKSIVINRAIANRWNEAVCLDRLAQAYTLLGETKKALDLYNQALSLRRSTNDRQGEGYTLSNIAILYSLLGEYEKALDYNKQVLKAAEKVADRRLKAGVLKNIGMVYYSTGDMQKSLQYSLQALSLLKDMGLRAMEATTLVNIGTIYQFFNEKNKAFEYFNRALPILREVGDRSIEAATLDNIGVLQSYMGDKPKALEYFNQALAIYRDISEPHGEARTLTSLGGAFYAMGDKQKALEYFNQALPIWRSLGYRSGEASTLANIGTVYKSLEDDMKALDYYNQALASSRTATHRVNEARVLQSIGEWYEKQNNWEKALDFYQQAIGVYKIIGLNTSIEEFKMSLADQSSGSYYRTIALLVRLGRPAEAFDLTEQTRSQVLLDQLANTRIDIRKGADAELIRQEQELLNTIYAVERKLSGDSKQDTFADLSTIKEHRVRLASLHQRYEELITRIKATNPEYASLRKAEALTLAEIQGLLDKDATLLSYFPAGQQMMAFIITRDSFQAIPLTVKVTELINAIRFFRSFPDLNDVRLQSFKQCYEWLIRPVRGHIKTPVLGIIPYGVLHYLPFAALTDGQHFLGESYTLFHLPSASVLQFIKQKRVPKGNRFLALAQSYAKGFPLLRFAEQEANSVAGIFNGELLVNEAATETELVSRVKGVNILHLAAHGELNVKNPLFSRIILASDSSSDGLLEVREVYGLDLSNADLVVLSACDTNLGHYNPGDDFIGLNRAFIYAGTPTVIASLWTADDEATALLMTSFYKHLKLGKSKAAALREAQADTRRKYQHPYYWAAFVLTGDPGLHSSIASGRNSR